MYIYIYQWCRDIAPPSYQKDDRLWWQMPDRAPPSLPAVLRRGLDASAGAASSAICTRRRSDAPSASDVRRAGDARASTFD